MSFFAWVGPITWLKTRSFYKYRRSCKKWSGDLRSVRAWVNSNWKRSTTFRRRRSISGLADSRLAFQRSSRVPNRVWNRKPMASASSSRGCASVGPVRGYGNETRLNGVIYPRCALPHMHLIVYEHDGRIGIRTWNREPTHTSNMYLPVRVSSVPHTCTIPSKNGLTRPFKDFVVYIGVKRVRSDSYSYFCWEHEYRALFIIGMFIWVRLTPYQLHAEKGNTS